MAVGEGAVVVVVMAGREIVVVAGVKIVGEGGTTVAALTETLSTAGTKMVEVAGSAAGGTEGSGSAVGATGAVGSVKGVMDAVDNAVDVPGSADGTMVAPVSMTVGNDGTRGTQVSTSTAIAGVGTDVGRVGDIFVVIAVVVKVGEWVVEDEVDSIFATEEISILGQVLMSEAVVEVEVGALEDDELTSTSASRSGRGAVVTLFFANQSRMYRRRSLLYSSFCSSVIPDR